MARVSALCRIDVAVSFVKAPPFDYRKETLRWESSIGRGHGTLQEDALTD